MRSFAQMCAFVRKCALVVRLGFDQHQSYKQCVITEMRSFQNFLFVVHVYVRLGKNLTVQNSKQPKMNARWKIQVYNIYH